jgi:hypothetical protein
MFLAAGAFLNPGRSRNSRSGYGPPQKDRFAGMGSWLPQPACDAQNYSESDVIPLDLDAGSLTIDET